MPPLTKIGEAFMGLQGVTAGDSSACAGVRRYIRAQNGERSVLVAEDAGQAVWDKAEKFLE